MSSLLDIPLGSIAACPEQYNIPSGFLTSTACTYLRSFCHVQGLNSLFSIFNYFLCLLYAKAISFFAPHILCELLCSGVGLNRCPLHLDKQLLKDWF